MQCCSTPGGLNGGSGCAADEEAGEKESWTPELATLSLFLCGGIPKDADAVEDGRCVCCARCSMKRRMCRYGTHLRSTTDVAPAAESSKHL